MPIIWFIVWWIYDFPKVEPWNIWFVTMIISIFIYVMSKSD